MYAKVYGKAIYSPRKRGAPKISTHPIFYDLVQTDSITASGCRLRR